MRTVTPPTLGRGQCRCTTTPGYWSGKDFWGGDWYFMDRVGDLGNSESQAYSPSQVTLDSNGYLQIEAKKQTYLGMSYLSGMIQWRRGITFVHGTLEIRVKMPGGTGPWPAVWLLGKNCQDTNPTTADNGGACNWPNISDLSDEIDFLEFMGSQRTSNNAQIHNELGNDGGGVVLGFDASAAFHTYQLVRTSGSLKWYADGSLYQTITSANVSDTPMGLLINIAVGGQGGAITDATLPQYMLVDYVRLTPEVTP